MIPSDEDRTDDKRPLSLVDAALEEVPFQDLTPKGLARDPHFGGQEPAEDIDYRRLNISLGNRPVSWRVRDLFRTAGAVLPAGLELYERFDVWMIAHAVSIADRGAFATLLSSEVDAVGYEAEFEPALATTIGAYPHSECVRNVGGEVEASVGFGLDGSKLASLDAVTDASLELVPGVQLDLGLKASLFGRLTFGVWTPRIVSTGLCSSRCEWLFNRDERPLRNTQMMFQTVLVPAGIPSLRFRARGFALIRSVGFVPIPSRFQTKWLDLETTPVASTSGPRV